MGKITKLAMQSLIAAHGAPRVNQAMQMCFNEPSVKEVEKIIADRKWCDADQAAYLSNMNASFKASK